MKISSNTNIPLLSQSAQETNGHDTNGRVDSIGGVESSLHDGLGEYSRSKSTYQQLSHNISSDEDSVISAKIDAIIIPSNPSNICVIFTLIFGCIIIFIGFIFHDNLFFNIPDQYILDTPYLLIVISFGVSFICYSIFSIIKIFFNCECNKNIRGFTIFCIILGICLLVLSIIGFLDEYVDSYEGYDFISYPIWLIFSLFGVSIMCFLATWFEIKYFDRKSKTERIKEYYYQKMLNEEGNKSDYKLPDNKDKLSHYIQKNGIKHPYDKSTFSLIWQTLTHAWLFNIIYLGSKRTLQSYDMYLPPKGDDIEYNFDKWVIESRRQKQLNPDKPFSSWKVLWKIERNSFCVRFFFMCLATLSGLIVPQIIGALAEFYEDNSIAMSSGIYLSIGLLLAGVVRILLVCIVFTLASRCVARIRALLTYAIYHKAINMAISQDSDQLSSGQKITLIAADTRIIAFAVGFEPMFFANAILIVMVCVFLHLEIGISALAGWIFMICISGPIQGLVGKKVQQASKAYIFQSDSRVKFIGELIRGIRVTKMYAWERALMDEVLKYRRKEMTQLLIKIKFISIMSMINIATPQFMALIMFGIYVLLGNSLSLRTVFAVITLIQLIRISIRILPYAIMLGVGAAVGFGRLNTFFNAKEKSDMKALNYACDQDTIDPLYMVKLKNATFKWPKMKNNDDDKNGTGKKKMDVHVDDEKDYEFLLKNISMKLVKGKLYALIGSVGSGKSSLIQAVLQEMEMISGKMFVTNKDDKQPIGYVSQAAFIMNDTVRENILWGLPFNDRFYNECLEAASLKHDLSILANGDLTEIGERGINLSGGQKQRISFCRALYRKKMTSLYLLDDPLSAVDVNVGNTMFHRGIKGLLKHKTILLVMNSHLHLLQYVDQVLIIDKGKLVAQATYKEIMENEKYSHLLPDKESNKSDISDNEETDIDDEKNANYSYSGLNITTQKNKHKRAKKKSNRKGYGAIDDESQKRGKLTSKEDRKAGMVKWNVYSRYFSNAVNVFDHNKVVNDDMYIKSGICSPGVLLMILEIVLLILAQAFVSGSDIWLAFWAEEEQVNRFPDLDYDSDWWLGIWSIFIGALTILTFVSSYLFGWLSNRAAQSLHQKTLFCVLRAPMVYFDSTPTGRILNRFSKDTNEMDSDLVMHFTNFSQQTLQVVGYLIVIMISMPYSIFLVIVIIPLLYYLQKYFRLSSSDIKRLDQVTTTPIIAQFSETLMGLDTIRAYKTSEHIFLKNMRRKIRVNHKIFLAEHMGVRWFGTYMDFLIVIFLLALTLFCTFFRDNFESALLSLAVVYGYAMLGMLQWAIRTSVDVEKAFTAVERLLFYETALNKNRQKQLDMNSGKYDVMKEEKEQKDDNDEQLITSEAQEINYAYRPPNDEWPYEGKITIKNLKMRYRKDLDFVLRGFDLKIKSGEKVGVCGRTGAGKSSLLLTLFRLVEPELESIIEIDDIDCLNLGLQDLRKSLSIIPQEPVLFSGSLRFNLDPFGLYSDDDVWDTLKKCKLFEFVYNKPDKLEFKVAEGGTNFSAGQKQLICIGRALLKKSKVLLLDEATSSIDKHTDSLIQTLIRKEFNNVTVICIAHRLETIVDYDKILVLSNGQIQEYDTPQNLLDMGEKSVFYQMMNTNTKNNEDNGSLSVINETVIEEEKDNNN